MLKSNFTSLAFGTALGAATLFLTGTSTTLVLPLATPGSAMAAEASDLFSQGLRDRTKWENWFSTLTGDKRAGAEYWAGQRSLPNPGNCLGTPDFVKGCNEAKARLTGPDVLRKSEPDYKAGWNSYVASATPAAVQPPPAGAETANANEQNAVPSQPAPVPTATTPPVASTPVPTAATADTAPPTERGDKPVAVNPPPAGAQTPTTEATANSEWAQVQALPKLKDCHPAALGFKLPTAKETSPAPQGGVISPRRYELQVDPALWQAVTKCTEENKRIAAQQRPYESKLILRREAAYKECQDAVHKTSYEIDQLQRKVFVTKEIDMDDATFRARMGQLLDHRATTCSATQREVQQIESQLRELHTPR